jgi:hypothetical protein
MSKLLSNSDPISLEKGAALIREREAERVAWRQRVKERQSAYYAQLFVSER